MAAARTFGITVVRTDGSYDRLAEKGLQRVIAALLMGGLVALFYAMARLLLPVRSSLAIASATGLSTQIWSTASRALWSHTFQILLVGAALWILLRSETNCRGRHPLWLATLVGWAWLVRPTAILAAAAISMAIGIRSLRELAAFLSGCVAWGLLLVALSLSTTGEWLPSYYSGDRFELQGFEGRLLGLLVSPARGLLLYVPLTMVVLSGALFHARRLAPRSLATAAGLAVALHVGLVAVFPHWWGGSSYGPRLLTDAVPWFVLLGILVVHAHAGWLEGRPEPHRSRIRATTVGIAATFAIAGAFLNGIGAISDEASHWNDSPIHVDLAPERLWDWSDPPFLRWLGVGAASPSRR